MAAANIYTGGTTADQNTAANKAAAAAANTSVMSTDQMPAMSATQSGGIISTAMGGTTAPAATTAGTAATTPPVTTPANDYTSQLNNLYGSTLGRNGDKAGLDFYNQKLASGQTTLDAVGADLKNSAEYKATHPTDQQTAYVPTQLGDPTKWNVTADQTVQGQMKNLIDPNNPYYQQWATAGAQDAAARGFTGNSSIRDSGILNAVMAGATPIATADASTYAKAAGYNTDQSNQFAVANQNAANTAGQTNANLGVSLSNAATSAASNKYSVDTSASTQKYLSDQSAATQLAVSKMSTQSQQLVSQLHDANSTLLQNNQSAQAAYTAYVNAVASIDIQNTMNKDAKATAIATQTMIFNQAIAGLMKATPDTPDTTSPLDISAAIAQVNGVDVSQHLKFDTHNG